ncbi:MAG: lamin tail domain-containing protein, partial [Verrucomicrobiota bacterium]
LGPNTLTALLSPTGPTEPLFGLQLTGRQQNPVLSEIMFHPPEDGVEFIEIHNPGPAKLDLGGWRFSDGIAFTFPPETYLQPGDHLVLTENPTTFSFQYEDRIAFGTYTGNLKNSGERLVLEDPIGSVRISLTYSNQLPWPTSLTSGGGRSIVLVQSDGSIEGNRPTNWRPSTDHEGSPGMADPTPLFHDSYQSWQEKREPAHRMRIPMETNSPTSSNLPSGRPTTGNPHSNHKSHSTSPTPILPRRSTFPGIPSPPASTSP